MRKIAKIILHCSASRTTGVRIAHVRAWHTKPVEQGGRGWKDVGYHYFIGATGLLEQGRPIEQVGAHVKGHNQDSIGICLHGLYVRDFNLDQFDTLKMLLRLLKHICPDATLHGHNEFTDAKTCPVFPVDEMREFWNSL